MANVHDSCSSAFWTLYKSVQGQSVTCRDAVLDTVKDIVPPHVTAKGWPRSNRTLRNMVERRAGKFWELVTQTHTIDVSRYKLPGCNSVKFSFVDPIYMWIQRCNELCDSQISLHWDAMTLHHPDSGEEVYGAGIQYSLLLRRASTDIPTSGKIALFNISWDGGDTGFGGRSAVPILVQVRCLYTCILVCIQTMKVFVYVHFGVYTCILVCIQTM